MIEVIKSQKHQTTTADWRLTPGYLYEGRSDFESAHILLGHFLADRTSVAPLVEKELLAADGSFEWGHAQPLEKVINSREDLEFLLKHPISRSPTSAPAIFICVGHQLAAECNIRLIRCAVKKFFSLKFLDRDKDNKAH